MFLNINNKLNISLCGMMGSVKSVIGKILAEKINYRFIDIDQLIENKSGMYLLIQGVQKHRIQIKILLVPTVFS